MDTATIALIISGIFVLGILCGIFMIALMKSASTYTNEINNYNNEEKEEILIKYFACGLEKIKKIEVGDWIDLRASKSLQMEAGDFKLIPLGIAMQLPQGYEAHVVPRSSTYKNFGIIQTNSMGIIDESYCGDNDQWYFPAYAMRDTVIKQNDRICQFRIVKKQPTIDFIEVTKLDNEDRGGIGSTGVN